MAKKEPLYPHIPKSQAPMIEIPEMLRKSMDEEVTAYTTYERRVERIKQMLYTPKLAEILGTFQHVMAEELEHHREFQERLKELT